MTLEAAGGKLMVVGAHAGDVENMAGATVLKHTKAGHQAVVVHMTLGEAGHPRLPAREYARQRAAEAAESARLMGAAVHCLPYADGMLPATDEVKFVLCDLIRRERPTALITHWRGSMHKDHSATHEIVRDALFYAALPAIERELPPHRVGATYFAENWEDMEGWRADVYLDAGDVWDSYLEVLSSHEFIRGGISSFRYLDYYDALGTVRGCLSGFRKAVALMLPSGAWVRKVGTLPGM